MKNKRHTINDLEKIAKERGGECLSEEYINCKHKVLWQCKNNHTFELSFDKVVHRGQWCKKCFFEDRKKTTFEDIKKIALSLGGKCLSSKYLGYDVKLKWQCEYGHIWFATPDSIRQGAWCKKCFSNSIRKTINEINELAGKKHGKCLSKKYNNCQDRLQWECSRGHKWVDTYAHVQQGVWCSKCLKEDEINKRHTTVMSIIKEKGGHILSGSMEYARNYLTLMCKQGHEWKIRIDHLLVSDSWCPCCVKWEQERKFRESLELLFGIKFNKVRPEWLRNPNGNRLEIDGFNEKIKLGFEYQGEHHFISDSYWNTKSDGSFLKRKRNDDFKKKEFKKLGIFMLYPDHSTPASLFEKFIIDNVRNTKYESLLIRR